MEALWKVTSAPERGLTTPFFGGFPVVLASSAPPVASGAFGDPVTCWAPAVKLFSLEDWVTGEPTQASSHHKQGALR